MRKVIYLINRAVIGRVRAGRGIETAHCGAAECVLSIWDGACVTPDGGDGDAHCEIMIAHAGLVGREGDGHAVRDFQESRNWKSE